jgi:hypothetical protein
MLVDKVSYASRKILKEQFGILLSAFDPYRVILNTNTGGICGKLW